MSGKKLAYIGVIFDAEGRILLREPFGHFNGYVSTFPKGNPDSSETPEQTALRETQEETGVIDDIGDQVPGSFPVATDNVYFLMRPSGRTHTADMEETRWCVVDPAR